MVRPVRLELEADGAQGERVQSSVRVPAGPESPAGLDQLVFAIEYDRPASGDLDVVVVGPQDPVDGERAVRRDERRGVEPGVIARAHRHLVEVHLQRSAQLTHDRGAGVRFEGDAGRRAPARSEPGPEAGESEEHKSHKETLENPFGSRLSLP